MDFEMRARMNKDIEKISEIVKEVRKQCEILGGVLEYQRPFLELEERLVCSFPEPVPLTRVDYEEAGNEGSLYIENVEGWNGVEVHTRGIPVMIDVEGAKGIASFDDAGHILSEGKSEKLYSFKVRPTRSSKIIKKAKRIEYYISPSLIQVVVK